MTLPRRIQRKRTKGWRMPPNTVYVGRGKGEYGKWGNPLRLGLSANPTSPTGHYWSVRDPDGIEVLRYGYPTKKAAANVAIAEFRAYACNRLENEPEWLNPLQDKNLACWCPLDQLCHADILLELANG
jgi:hypothetical protein